MQRAALREEERDRGRECQGHCHPRTQPEPSPDVLALAVVMGIARECQQRRGTRIGLDQHQEGEAREIERDEQCAHGDARDHERRASGKCLSRLRPGRGACGQGHTKARE